MVSGHRYRVVSVVGTLVLAAGAVLVANLPATQTLTTVVPVFRRLPARVLTGETLALAAATSTLIVAASLVPLFKPRPRRVLDTVLLTQKRVVVAGFAMATVGYFDATYPLPRSTLALTVAVLLVALPAWFVAIRRRPGGRERAVVVGDDPEKIRDALDATEIPVAGYVSSFGPSDAEASRAEAPATPAVADGSGGVALGDLDRLGGLSRLGEVLVEYDVDTAVLAFARPDRGEFFGALDACYDHGVDAKVHRDHADSVLTATAVGSGPLVEIELEPWDWQDYAFKRAFDVAFAVAGLVAFAPFIAVVAAAIKLDSPGPVFYRQERTAAFGETFEVYKFRSMVPEGESAVPTDDADNDRITRVGRVLRRTHLDEIPQLWSILTGEMSVVGPRAVWTDEEPLLEESADTWRKRWFVKPGLTGLAQIRDAKSTDPEAKLRYDLEYIREQSFWLDVKIVVRQVWKVLGDLNRLREGDG